MNNNVVEDRLVKERGEKENMRVRVGQCSRRKKERREGKEKQ